MSEKNENLSNKGLMAIGIAFVAILLIGIILYYSGLNEAFYSESGQTVFKILTYLGEPVVFIIIASILYIAYDKSYAKNLTLSLLITHYLNFIFKGIFADGRPPENEPLPGEFVEESFKYFNEVANEFRGFCGTLRQYFFLCKAFGGFQ